MRGKYRVRCDISVYAIIALMALMAVMKIGVGSASVRADGGAPQLAYVAGGGAGVSMIDIADQRVRRTLTEGGGPQMVLLSPDGRSLYLAQPELGRVSSIDASTGRARCVARLPGRPERLALSLDASTLYAAGQDDSGVRALNPQTCAVKRTFQTHEAVYGMAVAANTTDSANPGTPGQLWICGDTTLTVFEETGHLLGTLRIEEGPRNISIPGGFSAYITTRQGSVIAIDLNSRRVLRTLLRGGQFGPMDYDDTTGQVYVPDLQHHQLDVLTPVDADTRGQPREPVQIIPLSGVPASVAITNDGQLGFVALSGGDVMMLDIPARRSIASIHVGGAPHFIITGLYPPTLAPPPTPARPTTNPLMYILPCLAVGALVVWWRINRRRAPNL
ncbi:hypothetical protein KDH_68650 [Dictyobacter sp. S3.2.2.5]|uniref:YncE family protein n=1 Tax=Dictyobacter halimunensis TaxID=3026934 RepID=A0ABQ6G4L9_9CHLR|nr:hypothetical protein KDH_68650 [Dictyobacter sp. S3.2.2.5]